MKQNPASFAQMKIKMKSKSSILGSVRPLKLSFLTSDSGTNNQSVRQSPDPDGRGNGAT